MIENDTDMEKGYSSFKTLLASGNELKCVGMNL